MTKSLGHVNFEKMSSLNHIAITTVDHPHIGFISNRGIIHIVGLHRASINCQILNGKWDECPVCLAKTFNSMELQSLFIWLWSSPCTPLNELTYKWTIFQVKRRTQTNERRLWKKRAFERICGHTQEKTSNANPKTKILNQSFLAKIKHYCSNHMISRAFYTFFDLSHNLALSAS